MDAGIPQPSPSERLAIDIGSTVVKVAHLAHGNVLLRQDHYPRDFQSGIARQVESLLAAVEGVDDASVLLCSSANGGLRVGIVALSHYFSGAVARNQVLLAGGNPIFVCSMDEETAHRSSVDILLVIGGIDCADAAPLRQRLQRFEAGNYRCTTLAYAGNKYLADDFVARNPGATVISNPLADGLSTRDASLFEALRRAYLDDLVHKEGIGQLRASLSRNIRPTPEVVSRGFLRALQNHSSIKLAGACVLLDIGGATTDLHYTVELVRDDSAEKPFEGSSVARYVFVDLGVVASYDSTVLQLRTHPRLYEFLSAVLQNDVRDVYRLLRESGCPICRATFICLLLSCPRSVCVWKRPRASNGCGQQDCAGRPVGRRSTDAGRGGSGATSSTACLRWKSGDSDRPPVSDLGRWHHVD